MAEADVVIRTENLGKYYRLGVMHKDRLVDVISHAWNKITGRADENTETTHASHADHIWALRDANIEIRRGEVVGLIGRNGAGKSTLLKILTGVTKPTTGRAWMKGRLGSLLEVGTGFHPELTGRENIFLNGTILGMRAHEVRDRLDEIIAFAGLDDFIDTPVKRYSSGMYMRLAFSVAAHLEPEILLVDEVLAVGDAEFQKKCLGKMEDVAHHGRTVVFVSHNLYALQSLCHRGILLENGTVTMTGDLQPVLNRYLQNADTKGGEIRWPADKAPGDARVRLRCVRVVSAGQVTDTVDIAKGFEVEIEYDYLVPDQGCLVCLHINSALGQWLVHTDAFQEATLTGAGARHLGSGRYLTRCHVPGALLNDGQYSLSVYINFRGHADTAVSMRNVLNFHLQEDGYLRAEVSYMGPWTTLLRPKFAWDTAPLT